MGSTATQVPRLRTTGKPPKFLSPEPETEVTQGTEAASLSTPLLSLLRCRRGRIWHCRQVTVNQLDGDCCFPDRGRHSFDRATPSVTDNEDTGLTAFEQVRLAIERPPLALLVSGQDIAAGDHESVLITSEPALHPLGDRDPSDHDEEGI